MKYSFCMRQGGSRFFVYPNLKFVTANEQVKGSRVFMSKLATPATTLCTFSSTHWSNLQRTEFLEACWLWHVCRQWHWWLQEIHISGSSNCSFPFAFHKWAKRCAFGANPAQQCPSSPQHTWNNMNVWSQTCLKAAHICLSGPWNVATWAPALASALVVFLYLQYMYHHHHRGSEHCHLKSTVANKCKEMYHHVVCKTDRSLPPKLVQLKLLHGKTPPISEHCSSPDHWQSPSALLSLHTFYESNAFSLKSCCFF